MTVETVVRVHGLINKNTELTERFLRWQCRVRQIAMRDNYGRPDDAITPSLTLKGETDSNGSYHHLNCQVGCSFQNPGAATYGAAY